MNKARVRKLILALLLFFIAIQFAQPKRTNPPVIPSRTLASHVNVPEDVQAILMHGCGDCHSNRTVWPWYSNLAPFSWVITDDVNEGRRHMNFEDWDAQESPKEATDRLIDTCKEVREEGMPPFTYRIAHKSKRLTTQEIEALCSWTRFLAFPTASQNND